MSKGFIDKFHVHGALTPDPCVVAAKELPLPFKNDDAIAMPSFIGGRCQCEGGCIGFQVPNTMPPPPKKTPDDLPSAASLTTFVQVRYLQRLREKAIEETASTSKLSPEFLLVPGTGSAANVVPATEAEIASEQEPKQTASTGTPGGEKHLGEPSATETTTSTMTTTTRTNTTTTSPVEKDILIQTEPDDPVLSLHRFPFCC